VIERLAKAGLGGDQRAPKPFARFIAVKAAVGKVARNPGRTVTEARALMAVSERRKTGERMANAGMVDWMAAAHHWDRLRK